MRTITRKAVSSAAVIGVAAAILLGSAGSASAAGNSYVYQGSCGTGCFKYSNGSQNYYSGSWMGITFNLHVSQVPY